MLLVDYNNNRSFLDFRTLGSKIGSDGVFIVDYQKEIKEIDKSSRRYITKNYPIIFNGISYRLQNIHKKSVDKYSAELIQKFVEPNEIVKNRNGVLIDRLPNFELSNYTKTALTSLRKTLRKGSLVYLNFYNDDEYNFINFIDVPPILNKLKKSFPNLNVFNIGIINNHKKFDAYLDKFKVEKSAILVLNKTEHHKMFKLGYNNNPINGYLFNEKGNVIMSNISVRELKDYLYKNRRKKNNSLME